MLRTWWARQLLSLFFPLKKSCVQLKVCLFSRVFVCAWDQGKQERAGPRLSSRRRCTLFSVAWEKWRRTVCTLSPQHLASLFLKVVFLPRPTPSSHPTRLASPSHCAQAHKKFHLQHGALRVSAALAIRQSASQRHIVPPFSFPLSSLPQRKQLSLLFPPLKLY